MLNAPTVQVGSNTVRSCGTGVEAAAIVSRTVSINTIVGYGTSATGFGFLCLLNCTGSTVSGNQIFNTAIGASMKTSGETGSIVFENNDISGTAFAVHLFLQPSNTLSNNTITDSGVGLPGNREHSDRQHLQGSHRTDATVRSRLKRSSTAPAAAEDHTIQSTFETREVTCPICKANVVYTSMRAIITNSRRACLSCQRRIAD